MSTTFSPCVSSSSWRNRPREPAPAEPIPQEQLDQDMRRLFGTGDFEHVNYRFLEEPGKRILSVDAIEKKTYGPNYLRFGLGLSSDLTPSP